MSELIQQRWHKKLYNWALWKIGESPRIRQPAEDDWKCPPRPPQPLVGDALDTDDLLSAMQFGDQADRDRFEAILAWYTWSGSVGDWANTLRIHRDTLSDRVTAGRYRLDDLDVLRRRGMVRPPNNMLAMIVGATL